MVNVFPLLVWPYARIVQLNPSVKRDTSGFAVDSKRTYWVVGGGCTWSNVKTCFFAAEPGRAVGTAGEPVLPEALEGASIETEVEEVA